MDPFFKGHGDSRFLFLGTPKVLRVFFGFPSNTLSLVARHLSATPSLRPSPPRRSVAGPPGLDASHGHSAAGPRGHSPAAAGGDDSARVALANEAQVFPRKGWVAFGKDGHKRRVERFFP